MIDTDERLDRLGDALHAAAVADLTAEPAPVRRPRRRRSTRTKLAIALCAAVLAVPAVALATGALSSGQEVARGLPHGTVIMVENELLAGTEPTCTALRDGVEYECALAKPPGEVPNPKGLERGIGEFVGAPGEWRGDVAVTIDRTRHVNGGCRSIDVDGTRWLCYLGEAAVRHKLISRHFLGQYVRPVRV